jgi:pimeloyl-ACP methyl ester carboxylesterase
VPATTTFRRALVLGCAATALAAALPTAAQATTPAPSHYTGTLADGATWIADRPANWNGTLLLFSHGFGPLGAQDSPSAASAQALLAQGYALAGSSYDPHGSWWALNSAERDQFATLAAVGATVGRPHRVIAVGVSMGGLINSQIARDGAGRVDGALSLCGLVAGGVDLDNYQLDAEYTLATFLDPADAADLVAFSSPAQEAAVATRLANAVTAAQQTPQGRARIALAAAYLNLSDWAPGQNPPAPGDAAGQEAQQYAWFASGVLAFIEYGRYEVEQSAGGNTSWNAGVDYAALLDHSEHADEVRALYRAAGLDLHHDLATLTRGAHITADPAALAHLDATSTTGQHLAVPTLDIHTTSDQLVPVQQETAFGERVRASGSGALLRQAYVARQSHCNFTTAEIVAGVDTIDRRVTTGRWGATATAAALQSTAEALGLDGAAFTAFRPGPLVGERNQLPYSGR